MIMVYQTHICTHVHCNSLYCSHSLSTLYRTHAYRRALYVDFRPYVLPSWPRTDCGLRLHFAIVLVRERVVQRMMMMMMMMFLLTAGHPPAKKPLSFCHAPTQLGSLSRSLLTLTFTNTAHTQRKEVRFLIRTQPHHECTTIDRLLRYVSSLSKKNT